MHVIKKPAVLILIKHDNAAVNEDTQKPRVIHFYNETKGVDTVDQLCGNY